MGRSPCCEKAHTNKGAWTKEEDDRLIAYIKAHGEGCWRSLPKAAGLLRCGKSCRLRWINYLRPDLKRGNFTEEEDELIIKLHSLLGNKWSLIAGRLPGRTDNEIKNYWNTHIRRKLLNRGIDPATHRPIGETTSQDLTATATTICFAAGNSNNYNQEDQKEKSCSNSTSTGFICKEEGNPVQERCPDLNLELRISPPHQNYPAYDQHQPPLKMRGAVAERFQHCFACSLGLHNSKDCSCSIGIVIGGNGTSSPESNSSNSTGYDFLGLKTV